MSVRIIDSRDIDKLATYIVDSPVNYSDAYNAALREGKRRIEDAFCAFDGEHEEITPERLANSLAKLNQWSYAERYGDDDDVEPYVWGEEQQPGLWSQVDLYKALSSFLYQCEGQCQNTRLYRALENLHYRLAVALVGESPAYRQSQAWI